MIRPLWELHLRQPRHEVHRGKHDEAQSLLGQTKVPHVSRNDGNPSVHSTVDDMIISRVW